VGQGVVRARVAGEKGVGFAPRLAFIPDCNGTRSIVPESFSRAAGGPCKLSTASAAPRVMQSFAGLSCGRYRPTGCLHPQIPTANLWSVLLLLQRAAAPWREPTPCVAGSREVIAGRRTARPVCQQSVYTYRSMNKPGFSATVAQAGGATDVPASLRGVARAGRAALVPPPRSGPRRRPWPPATPASRCP
jgi:hypothetical protein